MTGEDAIVPKVRGHGFTDDPWGMVTRKVVAATKKLGDKNWAAIVQECSIYLEARDLSGVNSGQGNLEVVNLYADIDVD